MTAVFVNAKMSDDDRRAQLYQGHLFVYSPTKSSHELTKFAQELAQEAFAPHDPQTAQYALPAEKYAEILAVLKPKFIHHPRCKELIRGIVTELGAVAEETYFDVPRLRTMTHGDYFSAGLAYAFHPHRDTWFSAPPSQVNWWMPVYAIQPENTMAFHPRYWTQPVRNSSRDYNYYRWNKESRREAAKQIKTDTRKQPQAEVPMDLEPQIRLVCEPGGIIIFSGACMHSTVPNTSGQTRFSVDFRTVHTDDVVARRGAPNIDSECTGTTLRDFLRASDFVRFAEEIPAAYDEHPPEDGELIFQPEMSTSTIENARSVHSPK
ncbi:MAG: phytanoyl-CoA dioxygenase family protein [Planctomycetes bacterium]|nr:phytanoyl-CoA dioxygenase family protein [Planctomycetota bacterium]